ncbi:MAG TPA: hypothetical protein VKY85_18845 [Candidatus Angelobacter sp.]|nr:hypothetical protein [Candidatus Angelobacter sp.]
MDQLTGKIISLTPRHGYVPSLDIQIEISDSEEDEQVAFVWMLARVAVSFSLNTKEMPSRSNAVDVGIAVPRYTLPHFRKSTTTNFQMPFDERLLADLENAREGRDVVLFVSVNFSAIVKNPRTVAALQELPRGGVIADPRYGGQEMVFVVPRSQWVEIIQGLGLSVVDRQKNLDEYEAKGRQTLEDLNATLHAAKEAAKLVGIVEHARVFEEEAHSHRRSANWWLSFTIILALCAGTVAYVNFVNTERLVAHVISERPDAQNGKPAEARVGLTGLEIQLSVAKLIILSILLSGSIWAGRVYKSHRHNFVINRHRSNALSTFQTFATSSSDPQIKNAVLLQATTCIFGPQNTGYIGQEKEAETYPQILEIIRGVGGSAKSE